MNKSCDGQSRPLREQLKRHLTDEKLTDAQHARFEQLLARHKLHEPSERRMPDDLSRLAQRGLMSKRQFVRTAAWSAGAAMVAVSGMGLWFAHLYSNVDVARIAEEALTNHLKVVNPDFAVQSLHEIRASLQKLDFIPIEPRQFAEGDWHMRGARYCTLQGAIAAHMMYVNDRGGLASHYQAAYCPVRFGKLPSAERNELSLQLSKGGAMIRIWQESSLTMVSVVS